MTCLKPVKNIIQKFDLFCSNKILRVNSKDKYQTCAGGMISLMMIIATIIGFSSEIITTLEKSQYQSSLQVVHHGHPPVIQFKSDQEKSMMGIVIGNQMGIRVNLNEGPQIFQIFMTQLFVENGFLRSIRNVEMQGCTQQNWTHEQANRRFKQVDGDKNRCIKRGQNYSIKGNVGSKDRYFIKINIQRCVNSTLNENKCASPQVINNMFNISKTYYCGLIFINTVINPNKPNYLLSYQSIDNVYPITQGIITDSQLQISDYNIQSDQSILPFESIHKQTGFISEEKGSLLYTTSKQNDPLLGMFTLMKSSKSLNYTRTALKITTVISYMGGLIGAFVTLLFIINFYTNISLQICIAQSVFTQNLKKDKENDNRAELKIQNLDQDSSQKQRQYIQIFIYQHILKFFNYQIDSSDKFKKIQTYRQQIVRQLNISTLLRRLLKIQDYLQKFMSIQQAEIYKNKYQITLQKAKHLRQLVKNDNDQQQQKDYEPQNKQQKNNQDLSSNEMIKKTQKILQQSQKLSIKMQFQQTNNQKNNLQIDKKLNRLKFKQLSQPVQDMKIESNILYTDKIQNELKKVNNMIKSKKASFKQITVVECQNDYYDIPIEYINKKQIIHSNLRIQMTNKNNLTNNLNDDHSINGDREH